MTSEMAFAAVFTTAKRALSFQQKRAFIQEILFSFFKWGTSTQKKSFLKKWGGGGTCPHCPPPRFRGPCFSILSATAAFGYRGYQISVYLLATVVCGYKGYQISVYFSTATDKRILKSGILFSHRSPWLKTIVKRNVIYILATEQPWQKGY